jgi:hypothetical protein
MNEKWEWLGYKPGDSPLRFSDRGPTSPRKKSSSFRCTNPESENGVRQFPISRGDSIASLDIEKETLASIDTARSTCPDTFEEEQGQSYAEGFDDDEFVDVGSDDEETEFPSEVSGTENAGESDGSDESPEDRVVEHVVSSIRPDTVRGNSFDDDAPISTPSTESNPSNEEENTLQISPTGGKRAKPRAYGHLGMRPDTVRGSSFIDDPTTSSTSEKPDDSPQPTNSPSSSPSSSNKAGQQVARLMPKPLPPSVAEIDNDEKKIAWEKPEWAIKPTLKATRKGEVLKRCGSISDEKDIIQKPS